MSRGFVKEDDQEDIPIIPPRPHLPPNITNYVTQVGFDELLVEHEKLTAEKEQVNVVRENEKRIAINYINAKLQLLNERISSAKIVNQIDQPTDEVRFGARVAVKVNSDDNIQHYQLVGVDEADVSIGKISFISPVARILTNKKVGDKVILKLPKEERVLEVVEIHY